MNGACLLVSSGLPALGQTAAAQVLAMQSKMMPIDKGKVIGNQRNRDIRVR